MSEADKYSRNGKDKFLIREKSLATKAVHNEIDVCRNRISMGRSWNGAGRGFKALPKSLVFAKCCKPTTLSIDETGEEENWTTTRSKGHSFLYHNTIEDSVEEDTRLSCIQDGVLHDANEDIDRSSCMWRFKGLECDSMSVAKGSRRSLDNNLYTGHGSYVSSQCDFSFHASRSLSHSRQTWASSCNNTFSRSSSISEWHIPFEDIILDEMIARSCKGPIYKGRWHGNVMVHRITKSKREEFLKEIELLNLIRHENIILFMGACTEAPDLAIITSPVKGYSLYTHIHEKITVFATRSKIDIITQIAQGMEYLHAKKIELGKLCSRNIFLESKVKIGMTDYIYKHAPSVKSSYGYIPDRQILYCSPEILKNLRVKDGILCSDKPASFASDVFAFGTILLEIFLEEYPYATEHLEIVIWNISSGRSLQAFDNIPTAIGQDLVEVCWNFEQSKRPSFQQILESLRRQEIPRLNRQHSISQPNVITFTHTNFPM